MKGHPHISADKWCSTFPGRWIGRGGTQNWPSQLPDLIILDISIWGYKTSVVYDSKLESKEDLLLHIFDTLRCMNDSDVRLQVPVPN
jgi:hypothetical protein